jgi:hypothetical protein
MAFPTPERFPTPFDYSLKGLHPSPTPETGKLFDWREAPHLLEPAHLFYEIMGFYIRGGEAELHPGHFLLFVVGAAIGYNWGAMLGDFVRISEGRGP